MSAYPIHDEKELLIRLAKGDEYAFTALFHHYGPKVLHTAYLFTRSDSRSEDILQDVFMKLWLKRTQLNEIEDLENWIFIVTRNMSLSMLRRIARAETGKEKLAEYLPASEAYNDHYLQTKDMEDTIRKYLTGLTDQQRKVFELSVFKGLNRDEIAGELGLSPNTTKMHLLRATKYVRACLGKRPEFLFISWLSLEQFL